MSSEPEVLPLLAYAQMVWRRRLLVVTVVLGMAIPAFVVSSLQTPLYQSSAQVLVTQRTLDSNFNLGDQGLSELQINTQMALLTSAAVANRAIELGATSMVRGSGSTNSNVITVVATDPVPAAAAGTVGAFVQAYSEYRSAQANRALDTAATKIRERLDQLQARLGGIDQGGPPGQALQQQVSIQQEQLRLQDQLGRLEIQRALAVAGSTVVREPAIPASPTSPQPLRDSLLALVLGLGLGMSLAVVLETVRRRSGRRSTDPAPYQPSGPSAVPAYSGGPSPMEPRLVQPDRVARPVAPTPTEPAGATLRAGPEGTNSDGRSEGSAQ